MKDGSLALQDAIIVRLRGYAAVTALVGQNSFDRAPQGQATPFIRLGPVQVLPFGHALHDGCQVHQQIDCFSSYPGSVQAKQMQAAVIAALDRAALAVTGFALRASRATGGRILEDPDGTTTHAVIDLTATLYPA